MGSKELNFGDKSRQALENGINKVADAVKVTLGPRGKVVMLNQAFGAPTVTKDGVTVAKGIELADPFENMGAQLCKEVASKTNDEAGDGTTTATVLAQALVNEGMKYVTAGSNSVAVKRGMDMAVERVVQFIEEHHYDVKDSNDIKFIASIAGNNSDIGEQISKAMDKIGKNGIITIEETQARETEIELVDGMKFDRGYESPYFVTNPEKLEATYDQALIVLYEGKLSNPQEVAEFLEQALKGNPAQPIVFIAEEFDSLVLNVLALNRVRSNLNLCAVRAPGFGDKRKAALQDFAVATKATVVSPELGMTLNKSSITVCGMVRKIIVGKDSTILVDGAGEKEDILARINVVKKELEVATSNYDREKLQERLGRLSGGAAIIRIGANTDSELKEKKHRYEDALSATRAAVEEGYVVGGGVTLLRASQELAHLRTTDPAEAFGVDIVRKALFAPLETIANNAGFNGSVMAEKVLQHKDYNVGLNAATGDIENLLKAGIVDPAKVTRNAIQNAASIASLVLTAECLVTDIPEKENTNQMNPAMGF